MKVFRKILKILAWIFGCIFILLLLICILIQIPAVQDFARKKIVAYLESKIKTKVSIGKLSVDFPKRIVLQNVFFADQRNDTLLYGKELRVDIALFRLLSNEVKVQYISLNGISMNVYRQNPDTVFNYEYIVKAFASEQEEEPVPEDSAAAMKFDIGKIVLKNIRTTFKDDATGNDVYFYLGNFETQVKQFDPENSIYNIDDFRVDNVIARVHQYSPTLQLNAETIQPEDSTVSQPDPDLTVEDISLNKVQLNYRNDPDSMLADVLIGEFNTHPTDIKLQNLLITLKDIELNNSRARIMLGKASSKKTEDTTVQAQDAVWKFQVGNLQFSNNAFVFDDNTKQRLKKGMDYSHLDADSFNLQGTDFVLSQDEYKGNINNLSFKEQSGFNLRKLQAVFLYNDTSANLENIFVQTDNTILRDRLSMKYASAEALSKTPGETYIDVNLDECAIAVKDILTFAPDLEQNLKKYGNSVLKLDAGFEGLLKNISIPRFELSGLGKTYVNLSGNIKGLPDAKKAFYDLKAFRIVTTKNDVEQLVPPESMPSSVRLPDAVSVTGSFKGNANAFNTKFLLRTTKGNVQATAAMAQNESYNIKAALQDVDAGYLLKKDTLMGKITMNITAKGKGFDVKKASADYDIFVTSAILKNYDYRDLTLKGKLQNGLLKTTANIKDSNITFDLDAAADLRSKYPNDVSLRLLLDTVNLHALHLLQDTMGMHANIVADIPMANPDSLNGQIIINDIRLVSAGRKIRTDSVMLRSSSTGEGDSLHLYAGGVLTADLAGNYDLTKISPALLKVINNYYHMPAADTLKNIPPQSFQLVATLVPKDELLEIVPQLNGSDSVIINASFKSDSNMLAASLKTKKIVFDGQQADSVNIITNTNNDHLDFALTLNAAKTAGINLHRTSLTGFLANNQADILLNTKDQKNKTQYNVAALLKQVPAGVRFALKPDTLILNYDTWTASEDNFIQYDSAGIIAHNFRISKDDQSLSINSAEQVPTAPVKAEFDNFKIGTLTKIANQTALNLEGTIDGNLEVRNLPKDPVFTSDLRLNNITYNTDTIGNILVKVNNEQANAFAAHVSVQGNQNDIKLDGMYYTGESRLDLKLAMNQVNLAIVRPFTAGQLKNIRGILKGDINITGTVDKPVVNGDLNFLNAFITPAISGEEFRLSDEKISVTPQGIHFDNFTLLDSASNKAVINGDVFTSDFKDYRFAVELNAEDFVLVNTPQGVNQPFYGKLNVTTDVKLGGTLESPDANANIRVNKETNFTFILPSEDPEVQERKGVVVFYDKDAPDDTTAVINVTDTITNQTEMTGVDVDVTVETDSAASFTLVIDERNGDALTVKGSADLAGGIDKSGKLSLTGNYELQQGSYQVSLTVLKRKFEIQQGSTITWTGDPTKANVDITAIYLANVPPIDLLQAQLAGRSATEVNTFKQKLPFQVILKMTGELLQPIISFDISLPEDELSKWPDVDTKLQQVRADESELNKQVFAVLLLNRFVSENPFVSASGGGGAEAVVRQSASRILTDQLNQLAESLIKGVTLTFDINSEEDYASGTDAYRTDLTVGVSKSLLSDKLVVYVGSNFELEGPSNTNRSASTIAGDVAVDYKVSKDGRYKLRAYRKNEYEGVVEGEVIETGLSFIFTLDYTRFRELFEPKKIKKKSRPKEKTVSSE